MRKSQTARTHLASFHQRATCKGIIASLLIAVMFVIGMPSAVAAEAANTVVTHVRSDFDPFATRALSMFAEWLCYLPVNGLEDLRLRQFAKWIRTAGSKGSLARGPQPNPGVGPRSPQTKIEKEGRVVSLRVNPGGQVQLESQQQMLFTAIPTDNEGNSIHGIHATWTSSDEHVLFIKTNGEALAGNAGRAVIAARSGSCTATVNVVVMGKPKREPGRTETEEAKKNPGEERLTRIKNGRKSVGISQQAIRKNANLSSAVKHHEASFTSPVSVQGGVENRLPDDQTNSLYSPTNTVGSPPGKTKPGASTRAVATQGTETNGDQNFTFGLPVVGLKGRNLDAALSLVYNSQVWNKSIDDAGRVWMTYDVDAGWTGPGFRLGLGQIEAQGDSGLTLIDADGTRHALIDPRGGINFDTVDGSFIHFTGGAGGVTAGTLFYSDGTRVTYGATSGGGLRSYPTKITDRNGNYILLSYVNGVGPRLSSIEDTLQRYIYFYYDAINGDLIAITSPGLTGNADRQVMRFYYKDMDLSPALFHGGIQVSAPTSAHVLQYVYLPSSSDADDGRTGYKFDYSPYGMISRTTQFRGMKVDSISKTSQGSVSDEGTLAAQTTYSYPDTAQSLTDVPRFNMRTDDWAGRTTGGDAPSYQFSNSNSSGENISTITAPDGTVTEVHAIDAPGQWNDGLVTQNILRFGSATLSKTAMNWEQASNQGPPRVTDVRTTDDGATPLTKSVVYTYGAYENVISVSERDFTDDGSISVKELRRTETTYVSSAGYINRHLLRLPSGVQVFPGSSKTATSRVDYAYDDYGPNHANLTRRDDIIMHDPAFDPFQPTADASTDARGNLTSVTNYSDAGTGAGAITHSTTYDIAGNVTTAQVDCCQLKSFTYSGDGAYANVITIVSGDPKGLTTHVTYDYNTGLPSTLSDENDQVTSLYFKADSLRIEHVDYPGSAATYFKYGDALIADMNKLGHSFVETSTKLDNNGANAKERDIVSQSYMDGRGAVARRMVYQGATDGWAVREVEYDSMGRAFRASNNYFAKDYASTPSPASTIFWTTSYFDHFGRVYRVDVPRGDNDNSLYTSVTTKFEGVYTTVTDQANKSRRQKIDALGRVIRVDEPTVNGLGDGTTPKQPTNYYYDTVGNLVRVNQGEQDRYFKYDSLSRLIRERQVEQDVNSDYDLTDSLTNNNSWSRKIVYNSQSLITDAYDARGIHTKFTYDDLNRISQIEYLKPNAGGGETAEGTPTAHYYYDSQQLPDGAPSASAPDLYARGYSAGRLVAMTYGAGASGTYFGYDEMGRINAQFQLTGAGATPAKYKLTYAYNTAGLLTSETYPSLRKVIYDYDEAGRLAKVSDASHTFADKFQFTENGALKSETIGNGMVYAVAYNRLLEATQITLKQSSDATTPLQEYDYNYGVFNANTGSVDTSKNNGQIGSITAKINGTTQWLQGFNYDELGRLSKVAEYQNADSNLTTYSQAYTYDIYGNRFQSFNQTLGLPTINSSEFSSTTNRLTGTLNFPITYDAAGNITNDKKFRNLQYDYDANRRQIAAKLQDNTNVQTAVYDCAGRRVQTISNGITRTMVYDIGGQIVAEYVGNSTTPGLENIYRSGQLLAIDEASSASGPTGMKATPSNSNVPLAWNPATGVGKYRVERKAAGSAYSSIGTTSATNFTDQAATNGSAYLYRVCAADSSGNCTSGYSNIALGARLNFATDPALASYFENPAAPPIRAAHITELRTAIDAVRSLAGLPAASWSNNAATRAIIKADDVRELRSNLAEALKKLGLQPAAYSDATIITFAEDPKNPTTVRVAQIRELRDRATRGISPPTAGGTAGGLKYVLFDLQASMRAVMSDNGSASAVIARHDYLPFGEEVPGTLGLRSATQGYNSTDTSRQRYAATERDNVTGLDNTPWRKYESLAGRWTSPDPYGGSASVGNPQTFNRYSYVQNDPVNFADPTGLSSECIHRAMTRLIAKLAGANDRIAESWGDAAAYPDASPWLNALYPWNIALGFLHRGPSAHIHFIGEGELAGRIRNFWNDKPGTFFYEGGITIHAIEDVHGEHMGFDLPLGHWYTDENDKRINGNNFTRAANEVYQLLSGNANASLTDAQLDQLVKGIIKECGAENVRLGKTQTVARGGGTPGEMGAVMNRQSGYCVEWGTATYVSTDGGKTWTLRGIQWSGILSCS